MLELVHTRHNPLVDPALAVWGWEISVYLFLGGLVGGLMILSGYVLLRRTPPTRSITVLPYLAIVLLTAGMLALFLDLEHKISVWRVYTTFQPRAPMSWGSWILVLVYPALLGSILVQRSAGRWESAVRAVATANVALGAGLGIYTGVLLGTLGARPLWNSAALGPVFLLSGVSTAAALAHTISDSRDERTALARADATLITAELVVLLLLVIGLATGAGAEREAAALLLGGSYTGVFWVVVVGLGLVVPLILQSLALSHRIAHTPVAPMLVIAGGLMLRLVIVSAGQASHWPLS